MALDPAAIGSSSRTSVRWDARDCMLYALGVGAGVEDLAFTTENTRGVSQRMVPTMPTTLGVDFGVLRAVGEFNWRSLRHAQQGLDLLTEVPVAGTVEATTRIAEMWDKGSGALVVLETQGVDSGGSQLWRSRASLFIGGAGGWGGERGPSAPTALDPALDLALGPADSDGHAPPEQTVIFHTRPEQALIYRLSGDRNPLHSDPAVAAAAGLGKPIMHGLCTYGFAGRAVLTFAAADPADLRSMHVRFTAPAWPGDVLSVDLWHAGRLRHSDRQGSTATPTLPEIPITREDVVRFRVRRGPDDVVATGVAAVNSEGIPGVAESRRDPDE